MEYLASNTEKQESLPAFLLSQLNRPESDDGLGNFLPNTIEPDQPKSQQSNAVWFGNRSCRKFASEGAADGCCRMRAR
jgi:hypothetical protein